MNRKLRDKAERIYRLITLLQTMAWLLQFWRPERCTLIYSARYGWKINANPYFIGDIHWLRLCVSAWMRARTRFALALSLSLCVCVCVMSDDTIIITILSIPSHYTHEILWIASQCVRISMTIWRACNHSPFYRHLSVARFYYRNFILTECCWLHSQSHAKHQILIHSLRSDVRIILK